jgi:hypothetical protein
VTASDRSGGDREGGRPTPESNDPHDDPLETPAASRATLARRLRAVERALAGTEGIEFETAAERGPGPDELDGMADRLDALDRAVRTIGECLVARDRMCRRDDGTESVRQAVEALADAEDGSGAIDEAGATDPGEVSRTGTDEATTGDPLTTSGTSEGSVETDGGATSVEGAPAEWLDRVAAGGVAPPPVE